MGKICQCLWREPNMPVWKLLQLSFSEDPGLEVPWLLWTKLSSLSSLSHLRGAWNIDTAIEWQTPDGLYWVRRRTAYGEPSPKYTGSSELGMICPSFFLLPLTKGEYLKVQVCGDRRIHRKWHTLQTDRWKDDKRQLECIIQHYDAATWAKYEFWDFCTSIYMLNYIIRRWRLWKLH